MTTAGGLCRMVVYGQAWPVGVREAGPRFSAAQRVRAQPGAPGPDPVNGCCGGYPPRHHDQAPGFGRTVKQRLGQGGLNQLVFVAAHHQRWRAHVRDARRRMARTASQAIQDKRSVFRMANIFAAKMPSDSIWTCLPY